MSILEEFVEAYPRNGFRVTGLLRELLIYHGTTIVDVDGDSVMVRPCPSNFPELWPDIRAVLIDLQDFMLEQGYVCWLRKVPMSGVWYWLNGDNAGEEV